MRSFLFVHVKKTIYASSIASHTIDMGNNKIYIERGNNNVLCQTILNKRHQNVQKINISAVS